MKRLFYIIALIVCFSSIIYSQNPQERYSPYAERVRFKTASPSPCFTNTFWFNSTDNTLNICKAGTVFTYPNTTTTIIGSGGANRVTFWNGASSISSDSAFTFSSNNLSIPVGGQFQINGVAFNFTNLAGNIQASQIPNTTITNAMLAGSIANSKLLNSTISGVSLGSNLFALTAGTGITGSAYDGSTARTWNIAADAGLPTQTSNSGKFLTTNGTVSSWATVDLSTKANTALDNLASVSINSAFLFQSGIDVGSTTKPARDLYLYGSGTYGTNYFRFTGTPTSPRTVTIPDTSFTIEQSLTFNSPLSRSTNTISCPTCATTTFMPVFVQVSGSDFTTTSLTLVDITGLTIPLTTNAVYQFTCNLTGNGADSNGVKFGVNYSVAGAAIEAGVYSEVAGTGVRSRRINALNSSTAQSFFTSNNDVAALINGRVTTGANAGNLTIQVLKGTSGTATIYQGSQCMVFRIS
jgi:hypothetical protein